MQDAEIHNQPAAADRPVPLPLRDDTILGVCQALGEDFGVPANLLRIAFAAALLWNAEVVIALYLGLGVVVAASRLIFPKPRVAAAEAETPAKAPAGEQPELSLAA
jgi:phage shock protein C